VLEREGVSVVVADDEFDELVSASGAGVTVLSADGRGSSSVAALSRTRRRCPRPRRQSRLVLLTSGTTGPPKGARRSDRAPRLEDIGLVSRLGYRLGDTYYVAPPLFHAWGLSQATSSLATASTLILRRRFDPALSLA